MEIALTPLEFARRTRSLYADREAVVDGERRFTYGYEVTTAPRGAFELETSTTWKHSSDGDVFDFRHELEIGYPRPRFLNVYAAPLDARTTSAHAHDIGPSPGVSLMSPASMAPR